MDYYIEMKGIKKIFSGIVANNNIDFKVKKGEIHALLGENGAGKSTLMSILFGIYQPDSGEIMIKGEKVNINSPRKANELGIGMVHQHFKLVNDFTVLENIILGIETTSLGFLQMNQARKKVIELANKYDMLINPDAKISEITVGMQQRVEILKMLYRNNDILIFDEPTAVLTPQEIAELMKIMKNMAEQDKAIIFITHKLNEIKEVAHSCTILRNGKYIGTVDVKETSKDQMSEMMVGRKISFTVNKKPFNPKETVLSIRNLIVKSKNSDKYLINNISFEIRKGEILALAGIDGNGQSQLIQCITGLCQADNGNIILNGYDIVKSSIRFRNLNGISHIPEDRHKHGLVLDFSLMNNLILKKYFTKRFCRAGFMKKSEISQFADSLIKSFDIRCSKGAYTIVRSMSGGNQQKAIVAREIDTDNDLIIAVQPTRGLDVGAIEYIHKQLIKQREKGKAVLLVSLELDEVMDVSDRIIVIHDGELTADIMPQDTNIKELGLYMSGIRKEKAAK